MGFGGGPGEQLDNAQWLGAWAPGGKEAVAAPGYGTRLTKGTQVVMQVHYNLLNGEQPDISAMQLRLAPRGRRPDAAARRCCCRRRWSCRAGRGHDDSPLCDRDAAVADVKARFGAGPGRPTTCSTSCAAARRSRARPRACSRYISEPTTIRAVAGHMHLLGRSIKIEVNPGTPRARRPSWTSRSGTSTTRAPPPIPPIHLDLYDTLKVTCTHKQWLRDDQPSFETQREDRYVIWGEGSTDEMCLGIATVTHP